MVVAFEVPQTSKKLLKSCRAQSMYMRTSVWKAFLSSVTSAEKSKFNKDVIFKHGIIALSGLVLFVILHTNYLQARTKNELPV